MKNVIQGTTLSGTGAVSIAPGAEITIRNPAGQLVPLWADRAGTQPHDNPFLTDSEGNFRVYADSGWVHVRAQKDGSVREWRYVPLGSAAAMDIGDVYEALGAEVYSSVSEGLSNSAEGDYFLVESSGSLDLYRVVNGVAEPRATGIDPSVLLATRAYADDVAADAESNATNAAVAAASSAYQQATEYSDSELQTHRESGDHDGRYYTKTEVDQALDDKLDALVGEAPDQVPTNEIIASTLARDVYSLYGYGMELIAHRGFKGQAPQNTLLAMTTALARGADSLECDVQPSADGIFYLFHDDVVDELTNGTGTFTSLDSSYIDGLTFTATAGTPFEDLRISKFTDFLAFAKRRGVYVYAEIKGKRTDSDVDLVVQAIVDAGMSEYCMVQSFHQADLERVRSLNKRIWIGLLGSSPSDYQTQVDNLAALGRGCLLWEYSALLSTPAIIEYCASKNVDIGTWTVNSSVDAEKLLALGVRRIMSDISLEV